MHGKNWCRNAWKDSTESVKSVAETIYMDFLWLNLANKTKKEKGKRCYKTARFIGTIIEQSWALLQTDVCCRDLWSMNVFTWCQFYLIYFIYLTRGFPDRTLRTNSLSICPQFDLYKTHSVALFWTCEGLMIFKFFYWWM